MPIRRELRLHYPKNWPAISAFMRLEVAGGRCMKCKRPHLQEVWCIPGADGRWYDEEAKTWRDATGRQARWPDLVEHIKVRRTRVVLATCHVDHRLSHNRRRNLRAWCQRCHLEHDRPLHLARRRMTIRLRSAIGDLFEGPHVIFTRREAAPAARTWLILEGKKHVRDEPADRPGRDGHADGMPERRQAGGSGGRGHPGPGTA